MRARVNFWVEPQGKDHKKSDLGNFKLEGFLSLGFLLFKDFFGRQNPLHDFSSRQNCLIYRFSQA